MAKGMEFDILVLGSGPAGVVSALGLARLGYRVGVIGQERPFNALEGLSDRAVDGLRRAGCRHALASLPAPSPRRVVWNGQASAANHETLAFRPDLDRALGRDLEAAGIPYIAARAGQVTENADGCIVPVDGSGLPPCLNAPFVVEARGRMAPVSRQRHQGPATVALLNYGGGKPGFSGAMVQSLPYGWAWLGRHPDGHCCAQVTVDAAMAPPRSELADFIRIALEQLQLPDWSIWGDTCHQVARGATLCHNLEPVSARRLWVGDAALAGDPLSGNGIYLALSTALVAPAVVNTLLQGDGEARSLARRFYRERVAQAHRQFALASQGFYGSEQGWVSADFWRRRREIPVPQATFSGQPRVEERPVLEGQRIVPRRVLLSADHPLGIWHVDGVEVAPLLARLEAGETPEAPPGLLRWLTRLSRQGMDHGGAGPAAGA